MCDHANTASWLQHRCRDPLPCPKSRAPPAFHCSPATTSSSVGLACLSWCEASMHRQHTALSTCQQRQATHAMTAHTTPPCHHGRTRQPWLLTPVLPAPSSRAPPASALVQAVFVHCSTRPARAATVNPGPDRDLMTLLSNTNNTQRLPHNNTCGH